MSPTVDFAVWVLEHDGLQVSPFNKHSEMLGNRLLQDLGFTADNWQSWLNYFVAEGAKLPSVDTKPGDFFGDINEKWTIKLNDLWQIYLPCSNSRRYVEHVVTQQIGLRSNTGRSSWETLNKARGDMAPLQVILTAYPHKVELYIAPSTILLCPGGAMISAQDWEIILLRGIQSLRSLNEN